MADSLTYTDKQKLLDFVNEGYFDQDGVFVKIPRDSALFENLTVLARKDLSSKLLNDLHSNFRTLKEAVKEGENAFYDSGKIFPDDSQIWDLPELAQKHVDTLRLVERVLAQLNSLD